MFLNLCTINALTNTAQSGTLLLEIQITNINHGTTVFKHRSLKN